jgi:hypothetical protein
LVDMQCPRDVAREQKLVGEQVHLDLSPLPASIVDNPIHADWRGLGRPGWVDRRCRFAIRIVAKFDVANLVRHEEGLLEARSDILVKDQIIGGDKGRAAAIEDSCPDRGRLDVNPSPLGLGDDKVIGQPWIRAGCDEASVKLGGGLPGELHAVHSVRLQQPGAPLGRDAGIDQHLLEGDLLAERRLAVSLIAARRGQLGRPPRRLQLRDGAAHRLSQHRQEAAGNTDERNPSLAKRGHDLPGHVQTVGDRAPLIDSQCRERVGYGRRHSL